MFTTSFRQKGEGWAATEAPTHEESPVFAMIWRSLDTLGITSSGAAVGLRANTETTT